MKKPIGCAIGWSVVMLLLSTAGGCYRVYRVPLSTGPTEQQLQTATRITLVMGDGQRFDFQNGRLDGQAFVGTPLLRSSCSWSSEQRSCVKLWSGRAVHLESDPVGERPRDGLVLEPDLGGSGPLQLGHNDQLRVPLGRVEHFEMKQWTGTRRVILAVVLGVVTVHLAALAIGFARGGGWRGPN